MAKLLISEIYKAQQRQMHIDRPDYGVASVHFAPMVTKIINDLKITELLDYGCGKARLVQSIKPAHQLKVKLYDPGIEGIDTEPQPAQMVACIDVLEHIEPELLDNVLDDLKRVTNIIGFFTVHTGPAAKILPDGRNAHLIQKPYTWWLPKLWERFRIHSFTTMPNGFFTLVNACNDST